ncbi:MAG: squalene synthase HpnC [Nitrospirae bacterium]|nr:squalene synthase HpnC [Nitrospirota bacterium]
MAATHYENFPVGSRFIPKKLRPHVHSIYAFARVADDFADEPHTLDNLRLAFLENWENQLLQSMWRTPQHPVFIALKETIHKFDLPITLLQDLLMAFKMDVTTKRRGRFEDLLTYCRYSANPVGRLVLLLFGYRDPELHALSDSICSALQLANFWQDVAIDEKDRVYLPLDDMAKFGYHEDDLKEHRCNEAFRNLMRHEIARTRDLFHHGRPLCDKVGRELRFELHLIWNGGMTILDRIESVDYNVFIHRPTLGLKDKITVVTKASIARYGRQGKS